MPVGGVKDRCFKKSITLKALLTAVLFEGLKSEGTKIVRMSVDSLDTAKRLVRMSVE